MRENQRSKDNLGINDNTKTDVLIFAAGFIAGYAFKKVIESDEFNNIKDNASEMINNYFNHQIEYVDIEDEEIVDNSQSESENITQTDEDVFEDE